MIVGYYIPPIIFNVVQRPEPGPNGSKVMQHKLTSQILRPQQAGLSENTLCQEWEGLLTWRLASGAISTDRPARRAHGTRTLSHTMTSKVVGIATSALRDGQLQKWAGT